MFQIVRISVVGLAGASVSITASAWVVLSALAIASTTIVMVSKQKESGGEVF